MQAESHAGKLKEWEMIDHVHNCCLQRCQKSKSECFCDWPQNVVNGSKGGEHWVITCKAFANIIIYR